MSTAFSFCKRRTKPRMGTQPHSAVSSAVKELNRKSLHRAAYQLGHRGVVGSSLCGAPGFQQGSDILPKADWYIPWGRALLCNPAMVASLLMKDPCNMAHHCKGLQWICIFAMKKWFVRKFLSTSNEAEYQKVIPEQWLHAQWTQTHLLMFFSVGNCKIVVPLSISLSQMIFKTA